MTKRGRWQCDSDRVSERRKRKSNKTCTAKNITINGKNELNTEWKMIDGSRTSKRQMNGKRAPETLAQFLCHSLDSKPKKTHRISI